MYIKKSAEERCAEKIYFYCPYIAQKMKFSIKDFFSKCDQICSFLRIWSHLLKNLLMGNFSAVLVGPNKCFFFNTEA